MRGQEAIGGLLDAAGGRTAIASGARLSVERIEDHSHRRAFQLPADPEGLATLLEDGDIVRIDPITSTIARLSRCVDLWPIQAASLAFRHAFE